MDSGFHRNDEGALKQPTVLSLYAKWLCTVIPAKAGIHVHGLSQNRQSIVYAVVWVQWIPRKGRNDREGRPAYPAKSGRLGMSIRVVSMVATSFSSPSW